MAGEGARGRRLRPRPRRQRGDEGDRRGYAAGRAAQGARRPPGERPGGDGRGDGPSRGVDAAGTAGRRPQDQDHRGLDRVDGPDVEDEIPVLAQGRHRCRLRPPRRAHPARNPPLAGRAEPAAHRRRPREPGGDAGTQDAHAQRPRRDERGAGPLRKALEAPDARPGRQPRGLAGAASTADGAGRPAIGEDRRRRRRPRPAGLEPPARLPGPLRLEGHRLRPRRPAGARRD